jgi:hypothetical protein
MAWRAQFQTRSRRWSGAVAHAGLVSRRRESGELLACHSWRGGRARSLPDHAPARKDRPVWFDLPEMKEARDAVKASAAIVAAVASGDLTPSEASELSKVIDSYARVLQALEFEGRISKLEKAVEAR